MHYGDAVHYFYNKMLDQHVQYYYLVSRDRSHVFVKVVLLMVFFIFDYFLSTYLQTCVICSYPFTQLYTYS